jgi:acetyl esterase/lipase
VDRGFAIASVDYRLSPVARFPAQIHDINGAIRFLKQQASRFGLDAGRFAIAGSSAGGHLAALTGVSSGHRDLEGTLHRSAGISADVRGIVSFYGASNLQTILDQSTPHGLRVRVPALKLLLGGLPEEHPALARLASPTAHVDSSDPPLLLIHGDQDPQMPISQAHELVGRYREVGRPVELDVVHGGRHGGAGFFDKVQLERVARFLNAALD